MNFVEGGSRLLKNIDDGVARKIFSTSNLFPPQRQFGAFYLDRRELAMCLVARSTMPYGWLSWRVARLVRAAHQAARVASDYMATTETGRAVICAITSRN